MTVQAQPRPAQFLQRGFQLAGWLLLAVAALAAWPVTAVTGAGCAVAWLRGWPANRLGRQAGWTLPMAAVWMAAESARGWRAIALNPVRDGASGWPHLTTAAVLKTFLLVAPVTIPAGLALAALLWARYIHRGTAALAPTPRPEAAPLSPPAASVPASRGPASRGAASRGPVTQAPVALPAPRSASEPRVSGPAAVPASLDLDDILGPGVPR